MDEKIVPDTGNNKKARGGNVKIYRLIVAACFILYTSMMCAKSVFTAELVTFIDKMNTDKFNASLCNTYYFITYAAVQVILAPFMGRINVRRYLVITVPLAAVCGILVAFIGDVKQAWVLFAFTGAFQAGIYAGCMYILSLYLPSDMLPFANSLMQSGFAIGNTLAYCVSALFVSLSLWTLPYIIFGVLFLLAVVFFGIVTRKAAEIFPDAGKHRRAAAGQRKAAAGGDEITDGAINDGESVCESVDKVNATGDGKGRQSELSYNKGLFTLKNGAQRVLFYGLSIAYSILVTTLFYAINNWVGNFFKEVYDLPDSVSIVISLIVPIMTFFGPFIAISLSKKRKNYIKSAVVAVFVPLAAALALVFFYDAGIIVAMLLIAVFIVGTKVLTGFQSVATFDMRTEINAGSYSAMVNAAASVSAALAPTVMGKIIDAANAAGSTGHEGWVAQYGCAAGISAATFLFLLLCFAFTRKKTNLNGVKNKRNKGERD